MLQHTSSSWYNVRYKVNGDAQTQSVGEWQLQTFPVQETEVLVLPTGDCYRHLWPTTRLLSKNGSTSAAIWWLTNAVSRLQLLPTTWISRLPSYSEGVQGWGTMVTATYAPRRCRYSLCSTYLVPGFLNRNRKSHGFDIPGSTDCHLWESQRTTKHNNIRQNNITRHILCHKTTAMPTPWHVISPYHMPSARFASVSE